MNDTHTARIGIVGCGKIALRHIRWLLERGDDCAIAALCDTDEQAMAEKAAFVAEAGHNPPALYADYRRVLSLEEVDGVIVLLPHWLHHGVARAALEAGKHVLVEKPMVTSVDHALDLARVSRGTGRKVVIAYQRSYLPEYLYVKRKIREAAFGQLRLITAHLEQSWYRHTSASGGGWRGDPDKSGGGQLYDTGSHTLAAVLDVSGLTPVEVFASIQNCGLNVDVNTAMVVRFAEGPQAAITIGGFGHSVTESIRVVGEQASARIFFRTIKEQSLEIDGEAVHARAEIRSTNPVANLVDVVLGRDEPWAGVELGVKVAQVCRAAYLSAERNRPVSVAGG